VEKTLKTRLLGSQWTVMSSVRNTENHPNKAITMGVTHGSEFMGWEGQAKEAAKGMRRSI
jgi:hypothetical protein